MIAGKNTTEKRSPVGKPTFWNNKKRYYDLKSYWINRFGCRVHKLPIDAGFTCPNRDGSVATGDASIATGEDRRFVRRPAALSRRTNPPRKGILSRARQGGEIYRLFPDLHEHLCPGGNTPCTLRRGARRRGRDRPFDRDEAGLPPRRDACSAPFVCGAASRVAGVRPPVDP